MRVGTAALLLLALAGPGLAAAQAAGTAKKVGVLDMFPFAYKGPDGKLTGVLRNVPSQLGACSTIGLFSRCTWVCALERRASGGRQAEKHCGWPSAERRRHGPDARTANFPV